MRLLMMPLILLPTLALASSEDAWQEFRTNVETSCAALAPEQGETVIEVNPFGSERYGAALLITTLPDGAAERYVCIVEKTTGHAELTAPFPPPEPVSETTVTPGGVVAPQTVPHSGATVVEAPADR